MDPDIRLLEKLPSVILDLICEYLTGDAWESRTLLAFSLASKHCHSISARQRYKNITIRLQKKGHVKKDVKKWKAILEEARSWQHVRQVTVQVESASNPWAEQPPPLALHDPPLDEPVYANKQYNMFKTLIESEVLTPKAKKEADSAWLPLSDFVALLPGLRDLIWSCAEQVPLSLLRALEQSTRARLHVETFCLRSAIQLNGAETRVDADELALATSPCLYRITAPCARFNTHGHVNYNEEIVHEMVAGLAPNLKIVRTVKVQPGDSLELRRASSKPVPPWKGLLRDSRDHSDLPERLGQLSKLALGGEVLHSPVILTRWGGRTQMSNLRDLQLESQMDPELLKELVRLASDKHSLASLRRLSLFLKRRIPQLDEQLDELASHMFYALHPLQEIEITGCVAEKTFSAILSSHGSALRKLKFIPSRDEGRLSRVFSMGTSQIQDLSARCPGVTELIIKIQRTRGDSQEVQLYRALGTFPQLEKVALVLDCCDFQNTIVPPIHVMGLPFRITHEQVRALLINAAVDASLSISIFQAILANNKSLQQLILKVTNIDYSVTSDMLTSDVLQWIGRSWLCCRNPGKEKSFATQEIKSVDRNDPWGIGCNLTRRLEQYELSLWSRAWLELWPKGGGDEKDWKEEWTSFPLAELPEE
ncbi:hypothetical protein IQ07DRAFT_674437 [Pyrenochaeta sp. DS3sAY3a]|nr:hypothetical protein IQ07DRAFT_674437 [Pyrenochaeta sp. DS3sAY3a]